MNLLCLIHALFVMDFNDNEVDDLEERSPSLDFELAAVLLR